MKNTSVVIPVYGCPQALENLTNRLVAVLSQYCSDFEIIFVNDGCPMQSWCEIKRMVVKYKQVNGINLTRNFGQHNAIIAGVGQAKYDLLVVMDCDLQDLPEEIPKLLNKAKEGYDVVFAQRVLRQDSTFKRWASILFYHLLSYFTDTPSDPECANFGVYHRRVIDTISLFKERSSAFPLLVRWIGFDIAYVAVEHGRRHSGQSSYSIRKLFVTAFDIIISFSDKPLWLIIKLGCLISFVSFSFILYFIMLWLTTDVILQGWSSLIISIWFIGGFLMIVLGTIGIYLARVFEETRARPHFIIKQILKNESLRDNDEDK